MSGSRVHSWLLVAFAVAIALGAVLPAQAGYQKVFRFSSPDQPRSGVNATLNGLEVITGQYTGTMNPWGNGAVGTEVVSGVYNSTLTYSNGTALKGQTVRVGWNTSDASCRLRDLRWPNGNPIVPEDIGDVPGGGYLVQNEDGTYTWVITNDETLPLQLTNVEFRTFDPITLDELGEVVEDGVVGELIALLRAKVEIAWASGMIPDALGQNLLTKLDDAADDLAAGMEAYRRGDLDGARLSWGYAAGHMATFVEKVQDAGRRIPRRLKAEWIADANETIRLLGLLPEGDPPPVAVPQVLPPYDPEHPGQNELWIPLPTTLGPGDSAVLHGQVLDQAGNVLLDWADQVIIRGDMTPPALDYDVTWPDGGYAGVPTIDVDLYATDDRKLAGMFVAIVGEGGDPSAFEFHPAERGAVSMTVSLTVDANQPPDILFYALDAAGNLGPTEEGVCQPVHVVYEQGGGGSARSMQLLPFGPELLDGAW